MLFLASRCLHAVSSSWSSEELLQNLTAVLTVLCSKLSKVDIFLLCSLGNSWCFLPQYVTSQKDNCSACNSSWEAVVQFLGCFEPRWLLCSIRRLCWYCSREQSVSNWKLIWKVNTLTVWLLAEHSSIVTQYAVAPEEPGVVILFSFSYGVEKHFSPPYFLFSSYGLDEKPKHLARWAGISNGQSLLLWLCLVTVAMHNPENGKASK